MKLWHHLVCIAASASLCSVAHSEPIKFLDEVHPILAENCLKCHGAEKRKGGLKLDSREAVLEGGESGPAAVSGDHAASLMMQKILSDKEDERMPPDGRRLTPEEVAVLSAWIDGGIVWEQEAAKPAAYQAPLHLQPGDAVPAGGNLVDHYVGAYLAAHNVATPQPVSDAVFLRRASLDITGLLPTEAAFKAFLADRAPDKRARAIDALLADNQAYAEHWMSYWNDMLRNDFEGTGYIDGGRSSITDWIYQALLDNKPYDKFVDELIDPRPSSEGFIKGIVWRGDNATVQLPSMQASANVSLAFLGVNMKCAMCHDSFVSHWKLKDAFGLANCFSETPMGMVRCDVPMGEPAPYKFLWPELGEIDGNLSVRDRQKRVAELVTMPENGFFTRTIVNRLWALFFGRGLVEPLELIENEPWDPCLLDALAQDLIDHGYDLKHTMALMMKSQAYGWRSVTASPDPRAPFVFGGPIVRRMSAEEFYDALSMMTGVWHDNPKFLKPEERKDEMATGPVRAWRLSSDTLTRAMGRTNRETVTTRRDSASTTLQFLELTNGSTLAKQVKQAAEKVATDANGQTRQLVLDLYRRGLQRSPSKDELTLAASLIGDSPAKEGVEDLLWTLIMLPEFQLVF